MAPHIQPLYFRLLQLFDQLQFLQNRFLNSGFVQKMSVLYTAGLLLVAFAMLAYWLYCASLLVTVRDSELTENDISLMRWNRRCWAQVQFIFLSNRSMLQ